MKFKRFSALFLVLCMVAVLFAGCGKKADWDYIKDNKKLVIGITLYEPMNYYDNSGKLTGFDTEFAEAVCEELGITPVFQEIDWEQKEFELKSKAIDCIWNGLTVTEDRKANMAFSKAYVRNKQVVVVKKANAEKYSTIDKMAGATVTAENGSAGQSAIEADKVLSKNKFVASAAQKDVLLEVKAGTIEIGVIDYVMANAVIGDNTDYSDLTMLDFGLTPEEYAIGLRLEDTKTLEKINGAIDKLVKNGKLAALAEKYGLSDVFAFK